MNGVIIKKRYLEYKDIYKKYLGDDYNFEDEKYSLIISNHIGIFDIVLCCALYASGFVARKDIKDAFLVGKISSCLNCLLVDRDNESNRKLIFDSILNWQKTFYNETYLAPLTIFPEGANSCGRNILRFKKGAFFSLLPVKPLIVAINQNSSFHLSVGASNAFLNYGKNLCHFANYLYYTELPIIRPTEYMFEKYGNSENEKWEIYSNIVLKMYSENGGLEEVDMGFRDMKNYIKEINELYEPKENENLLNNNEEYNNDEINKDSEVLEINTETQS